MTDIIIKYNDQEQRHCEDGPAVILPNGTKKWYVNGQLHRTDGPAIDGNDGLKKWYADGKLHRTDGPALIRADKTEEYYQNGLLHREDGPAKIDEQGTKEWYQNNLLHREDGPAIEKTSGQNEHYIKGELKGTEFDFQLKVIEGQDPDVAIKNSAMLMQKIQSMIAKDKKVTSIEINGKSYKVKNETLIEV